jgi:beta-N-acetylhexosaminidase
MKIFYILLITICAIHSFLPPCFGLENHPYSIAKMTLEEKVGQLLLVHFNGEVANEDAKALIQEVYVGGIIYYNWANGLHSLEQIFNLSSGLQKLASQNRMAIPIFIAVDQEGGIVSRLTKGFTPFPGNQALGMTGDGVLAEKCTFAMGQEMRAVGVNFNLAPVVDVNSNPKNPVIGIRSFGNSTDSVIPFAEKAIQGYHRAEIITSLKHFPGHGDVEVDSHHDLPLITKTKEQLQTVEFLPFAELASQADTIMTAHLLLPLIDPDHCATLSKTILDILRKEMHFDGAIITDSLVMQGVLNTCSCIDEAAIRALNAGCDILLLGGKQLVGGHLKELTVSDVKRVHQSLLEAVKSGLVSEKRVDEAVQRILNLKNRYPLSSPIGNKDILHLLVNTVEHRILSQKIASLALKVMGNQTIVLPPLDRSSIAVFAPKIVEESINQTPLLTLGKETLPLFFNELNPSEEEARSMMEIAERVDLSIFCCYSAWKNSAQLTLIHSLSESKKPFIVIVLRDPLDATLISQNALILNTFSPTVPSIRAACDSLRK